MKKIFSILGGICIVTLFTVSCTHAYTQEQQEAYQWAYRHNITTQPTIEKAKMDGNITRQAFAKMIVNYLENVVGINQTSLDPCYFPDENKITNDLKPYARKTCALSIMGSNGKNFNPTNSLSRAQLGTVLSRILWGDKHDSSGKGYYIYHVNALQDVGIMDNINNVSGTPAKRGDVLVMLKRMYEKFGSNIDINGGGTSFNTSDNISANYITFYEENVIYTGKDGTEYIYDNNFLNMLKNTANKKGESDLAKYLGIEAEYFASGLNQLESFDLENLPEMLGFDEDLDPETMTKKEKEALLKKIKGGVSKLIKENKDRNDEYIKKLEKVTKDINNDKFGLKEKFKQTKEFMDTTDSFLVLYSEIIFEVFEMSLISEEEIDDETGMGIVFGLMGSALAYEGETEEYKTYLDNWANNVVKILINGEDAGKITRDSGSNKGNYLLNANIRAKDEARKNDLSQIQTAIVISQQDNGVWPGMDKNATKGMSVGAISTELINAGMKQVPSDPDSKNSISGLGEITTTMGEYSYIVAKKKGYNNGGFVVMANTESEGGSNWVVCDNKNMGLENGYITNNTDLMDIKVCTEFKKGNSCSASNCTYTDEDELRYILIY